MLVTLLAIALVLETLGILVSVKEYRDGRERWVRLTAPVPEEVPRTGGRVRGGVGKATWSPPEPANMEERVGALEKRLNWYVRNIRKEIGRVSESVPKTAEKAASDVEERLEPTILNLMAYLSGNYEGDRAWWLPRWWIGPALLAAGVVVGFVANLWGAFNAG